MTLGNRLVRGIMSDLDGDCGNDVAPARPIEARPGRGRKRILYNHGPACIFIFVAAAGITSGLHGRWQCDSTYGLNIVENEVREHGGRAIFGFGLGRYELVRGDGSDVLSANFKSMVNKLPKSKRLLHGFCSWHCFLSAFVDGDFIPVPAGAPPQSNPNEVGEPNEVGVRCFLFAFWIYYVGPCPILCLV